MNYKIKIRFQQGAVDHVDSDYVYLYPYDMHIVGLVQLIITGVVNVRYEV